MKQFILVLYICCMVPVTQGQILYTVEMVNHTKSKYISFRVITGANSGRCLTELMPNTLPYIEIGEHKCNMRVEHVYSNVCDGRMPCQLKVYEGEAPNCSGNDIGTVILTTNFHGLFKPDEVYVLNFIVTHNKDPDKYILIGDRNRFEIRINPGSSY